MWIKAYDKFGFEGIKWKADERRLGKGELVTIEELVIGAHLRMPHLRTSVIYDQLKDKAKRDNFCIPSYKTVCRYIDSWKKNNKSAELLTQNPDKWKSKYQLAIGSYSEEAIEPNERIKDFLDNYPESTAGRTRIKFILEHEEVKNLYQESDTVLANIASLV